MRLSENICKLRKERNWSQNQLGRMIAVDGRQICRYERGNSIPSVETIIKLADIFGVAIDDLVFDRCEGKTPSIKDSELLGLFQIFDRMGEQERSGIKYVLKTFTAEDIVTKEFLRIPRQYDPNSR